jgi:hypothetical protein
MTIAACFAVGCIAGALYFVGVLRSVRGLLGAGPRRVAVLSIVGRQALLALVLAVAARGGAAALLATAGGVLAVRPLALRGLAARLR